MKNLTKWAGYLLYYCVAQYLPANKVPIIGYISKTIRVVLCRLIFVKCGSHVTIGRRAYWGFNQVAIGDYSGIWPNFTMYHSSLIMGNHVLMAPNLLLLEELISLTEQIFQCVSRDQIQRHS